MRILLLNQTFYPDTVASAQHLADLAAGLARRGHDVTVLAAQRAYDNPTLRFPPRELWRGVRILRVPSPAFGKSTKIRRLLGFAGFLLSCAARLLFLPRPDVVVALTSPPLLSVLAAAWACLRRCRFVYWVMDLNPDEALAAGWLRPGPLTRALELLSRFSLNRADAVIALDRFMLERLLAKGISPQKITVLPPWAHDPEVHFTPAGRAAFRHAHGLAGKFVVMHSGNHSPCHPLDTLLAAARRLAGHPDILFCFIGGGVEFARIAAPAPASGPMRSLCLPYQPLSGLAASLSAADLHVVLMGAPFVGLVHPCKLYNILRVGAPLLYLGPRPSHVTDALHGSDYPWRWAPHGDIETVVDHIRYFAGRAAAGHKTRLPGHGTQFTKHRLLPKLIQVIESAGFLRGKHTSHRDRIPPSRAPLAFPPRRSPPN